MLFRTDLYRHDNAKNVENVTQTLLQQTPPEQTPPEQAAPEKLSFSFVSRFMGTGFA